MFVFCPLSMMLNTLRYFFRSPLSRALPGKSLFEAPISETPRYATLSNTQAFVSHTNHSIARLINLHIPDTLEFSYILQLLQKPSFHIPSYLPSIPFTSACPDLVHHGRIDLFKLLYAAVICV